MPYASDRDRNPQLAELERTPEPASPQNLFLTSGFKRGVFDLTWDNPASLALNSRFHICGVNIYRSFDSEFGPFERITELPVGATFWRDQTDNVLVSGEVVGDDQWILRGTNVGSDIDSPRYVFRTQNGPIVSEGSQNTPTSNPADVRVFVDGVEAQVKSVIGASGEVELLNTINVDVATQSLEPCVLPSDGSEVKVYYRYTRSFLRTDLFQRVFYRATTVGVPVNIPLEKAQPTDLVETPLERAASTSSEEIEKLDWIWREAVRRNGWILDQGGERVKVLIRKQVGAPCPCVANPAYKQALNDCASCFGTRIVGGYEGPYDIIIAPDDAERRIAQTPEGRKVEHVYEVWTGPRPLLAMRDLIVKINGTRYSVGAVRMPTNRGMVLQQHFTIGYIDELDVRYTVPVDRPYGLSAFEVPPVVPPDDRGAIRTEKPNIPNEREIRGRTVTWENIVY